MAKTNSRANNSRANNSRANNSRKPVETENDYDNANKGALFVNNRRDKPSQPNMSGSLNVVGVDYWLSAWSKRDNAGNKFLSLSASEKGEEPAKGNSGKLSLIESGSDNAPQMSGYIKIDGEKINLLGWFHKQKRSKDKYISLVVSENETGENIEDMPWDF